MSQGGSYEDSSTDNVPLYRNTDRHFDENNPSYQGLTSTVLEKLDKTVQTSLDCFRSLMQLIDKKSQRQITFPRPNSCDEEALEEIFGHTLLQP